MCIDIISDELQDGILQHHRSSAHLLEHLLRSKNHDVRLFDRESISRAPLDWDSLEVALDVALLDPSDSDATRSVLSFLEGNYDSQPGLLVTTCAKLAVLLVILREMSAESSILPRVIQAELSRYSESSIRANPLLLTISWISVAFTNHERISSHHENLLPILNLASISNTEMVLFLLGVLVSSHVLDVVHIRTLGETTRVLVDQAISTRMRDNIVKKTPLGGDQRLLRVLVSAAHLYPVPGSLDVQWAENTDAPGFPILKSLLLKDLSLLLAVAPYLEELKPVLLRLVKDNDLSEAFWYGGASVLVEAAVTEQLRVMPNPPSDEQIRDMKFKQRWLLWCKKKGIAKPDVLPDEFYGARSNVVHHEKKLSELDKRTIVDYIPRILDRIFS